MSSPSGETIFSNFSGLFNHARLVLKDTDLTEEEAGTEDGMDEEQTTRTCEELIDHHTIVPRIGFKFKLQGDLPIKRAIFNMLRDVSHPDKEILPPEGSVRNV